MKALQAPKPRPVSVRGKHDRNDRQHLFLFLSVFELWIYRMLDAVPSAGCVVCGAQRENGRGFLIGAPFVALGMKVLEMMCAESGITGAQTKYPHFDVDRYRRLVSAVRSDGESVWSCADCFTYTMVAMGVVVVKTRGVSCHCAYVWVRSELQRIARKAAKAVPAGEVGSTAAA